MKNLIVLMAVMIILMVFPLQYATEQKNHHNISIFQGIVNNGKELAKQDGYFSTVNINEIKLKTSEAFKTIGVDEVQVIATTITDRKVRGEIIYYRIGVPIKKLLAASTFWGIDPADNQMIYWIENYTSSEWVN